MSPTRWFITGDRDKAIRNLTGLGKRLLYVVKNWRKVGNLNMKDSGWITYANGSKVRAVSSFDYDQIHIYSPPPIGGVVEEKFEKYIIGHYGGIYSTTSGYVDTYFWGIEYPNKKVYATKVGHFNVSWHPAMFNMIMNDKGIVVTADRINYKGYIHVSKDYGKTFQVLPLVFDEGTVDMDDLGIDVRFYGDDIYVMHADGSPNYGYLLKKYVPDETDYYNGTWEQVDSWTTGDLDYQWEDINFWLYDKRDEGGNKTGEMGVIWAVCNTATENTLTFLDHNEYSCSQVNPFPWPEPGVFAGETGVYHYYDCYEPPCALHNGNSWLFLGSSSTIDVRYIDPVGNTATCPFDDLIMYEQFPHGWYSDPVDPDPPCAHFHDYINRTAMSALPVEFKNAYYATVITKNSCTSAVLDTSTRWGSWGTNNYNWATNKTGYEYTLAYDISHPNIWVASTTNAIEAGPVTDYHYTGLRAAILYSVDDGDTWELSATPSTFETDQPCHQSVWVYDRLVVHSWQMQSSKFEVNVGKIKTTGTTTSIEWENVLTLTEDDLAADTETYPDVKWFVHELSYNKIAKKKDN